MKFRLKGEAFATRQVVTEFDSDAVSVLELKCRVSQLLSLEEDEQRTLELSFNGKQAIVSEDSQLLASLGFVSGDAVYILGAPAGRSPKCPKMSQDSPLKTDSSKDVPTMLPLADAHGSHNANMRSSLVLLADSPENQTPECFKQLIAANPEKVKSPFEEFAGLLHILMVETGFLPESSRLASTANPFCTLPDSWDLHAGTLKLQYRTSLPPQPTCTMTVTEIGSLAMVYGTAPGVKTMIMKLKPSEYLRPAGGKLRELSRDFKNQIAFPLLVSILREAGGYCPPHFSNLPEEILDKILRFLDFRSLCSVSATSHLFHRLANEPVLWKRLLVIQKFGASRLAGATISDGSSWKDLFKEEYLKSLRERRMVPRRPPYVIPVGPFGPQPPFPPEFHPPEFGPGAPYPFPGVMGGYGDLFPDIGGLDLPRRLRPDIDLRPPRIIRMNRNVRLFHPRR